MTFISKSLLTGTALALLMSAPAFAAGPNDAVSSPINLRGDLSGDMPDFNDPTAWNTPGAFYRDGGPELMSATGAVSGAAAESAGRSWSGYIGEPTALIENHQSASESDVWGYSANEAQTALGASAVGVALGNTASATVTEDVSVQIDNDQYVDGIVESQAQGYFGEVGSVTNTATTYANTFTAESDQADIGMNSLQAVGGGLIKSRALIEAAEYAESAAAAATTGANTLNAAANEGYVAIDAVQANSSRVEAIAEIAAPDADVLTAVGTSIAVINNLDLETYGDAYLAGEQRNGGDANTLTSIQAQGTLAAVGTTVLTGNNMNMINEGGVGEFNANQGNSGDLLAQTIISVGAFPGQSTGDATAIGNNASSSTTGPSSDIRTVQNNSGGVIAQSLFTGGSGVTGVSGATAYGNAATGTLCNCDGEMTAYNQQGNTGTVRAHTYNLARDATVLTSTSVAAGNTATYTVGSP